jgi:hypothetical protein
MFDCKLASVLFSGVLRFTGSGSAGVGGTSDKSDKKGVGWSKHQQEAVFSEALDLLASATDCYR